jgi:hypothetical protein
MTSVIEPTCCIATRTGRRNFPKARALRWHNIFGNFRRLRHPANGNEHRFVVDSETSAM